MRFRSFFLVSAVGLVGCQGLFDGNLDLSSTNDAEYCGYFPKECEDAAAPPYSPIAAGRPERPTPKASPTDDDAGANTLDDAAWGFDATFLE